VPEPPARAAPVLATLAGFGVETDDVDAAVISAVLDAFEPAMLALIEADLADVSPEVNCDPSGPPR